MSSFALKWASFGRNLLVNSNQNCSNVFRNKRYMARMLSDPENRGSRQQHINFDILGIWDSRMDFTILFQESIKHGMPIPKITCNNVGHASLLGRRETNEDRFRVKELTPNLLYFAVYDGHGGSLCADFCSRHMEDFIMFRLRRGDNDLQGILEKSFIDINNVFARYVTYNVADGQAQSGTTATVCLLRNSVELVVGHVGDSRALLCRNGLAQKLTVDHTAELFSEKERISKSGGQIIRDTLGRYLVNGRLAMSRSIGDFDLKRFGVTSVPDTRCIQLKHGKDAFLILTTDGINFVMNDQEIINAVNSCRNTSEAAQYVADQAMIYASQDNASSLIIPFGAWGKYNSLSNNIKFSFGRQLSASSRC